MKCGKCGREIPLAYPVSRLVMRKLKFSHRICPKRKGRKKAVRVRTKGIDFEATAARDFTCRHGKSVVLLDGRETLHCTDYTRRVREVEERDGYKCQWSVQAPPLSFFPQHKCNAPSNGHPHHIVKRSKGRDDRASNLMAICDAHHKIAHPEKQPRFTTSAEKRKAEEDFNALYPKGGTP
jgi:hypothetical protein